MKTCIIFGGTGFIGVFFATFLLKKDFGKVILVDIQSIDDKENEFRKSLVKVDSRIFYLKHDIRTAIEFDINGPID